jgi:hypothetical protein
MSNTTHNRQILDALLRGESLTHLDAERRFECARIAARVSDLRNGKIGSVRYDIETLKERNADGWGYHARYRLKLHSAPQSAPYSVIVPVNRVTTPPPMPPAFDKKVEKKIGGFICGQEGCRLF